MRLFIILFAVIPFTAFAQQKLSLSEAIEIGLANSYPIKIAQTATAIADQRNDWSMAGKYPNVNVALNANNSYTNSDNPASVLLKSSTLSNGLSPSINAGWILYNGKQISYTKSQLEQQAGLSSEELSTQIQNSIQTIIQAYYNVLIQAQQLNVLKEVMALSHDRINYQEIRQEYGQAGTFDLLQAQDAYLSDSTRYLVQQNSYENSFRNLKLAMGVTDTQQYILTDSLYTDSPNYQQDELEALLTQRNPDLKAANINRQLARINAQIQGAARQPTVSLNAGVNYNVNWANGSQTFSFQPEAIDIPGSPAKTWQGFANLSATYNLWDGGIRNRRIEIAQLQEMQTQLVEENLLLNLTTQLRNTFATYQQQQELLELTTKLVDNAYQSLAIAEERHRGGIINSFDYRTIQLAYVNATQSRLNTIFNLKTTETQLLRLVGGLMQ